MIQESLRIAGLTLEPWRHDSSLTKFTWRTMEGLLDLRNGGLMIIGIFSDHHGTGRLGELMDTIESMAAAHSAPVRVVQIWNQLLAKFYHRRGYTIGRTDEFGRYAEKHFTQVGVGQDESHKLALVGSTPTPASTP